MSSISIKKVYGWKAYSKKVHLYFNNEELAELDFLVKHFNLSSRSKFVSMLIKSNYDRVQEMLVSENNK